MTTTITPCPECGHGLPDPLAGLRATPALPSPADHAEMPKRMVGRRLVRTCSCGKPWPCEEGRWNQFREVIKMERDAQDELAAEHAEWGRDAQSERCYTEVKTLDWVLATMDRMEAGR